MKQLSFDSILSDLNDIFLYSTANSIEKMHQIFQNYLSWDNVTNQFTFKLLSNSEWIELFKNYLRYILKYDNFKKLYYKDSDLIDRDWYSNMIKTITETMEQLYDDKIDDKKLHKILENTTRTLSSWNGDNNGDTTIIKEYLLSNAKLLGITDQQRYAENIKNQIEKVLADIFALYYEKILNMYNILVSLSLTNNSSNVFRQVRNDQITVTQLESEPIKAKLSMTYKYINVDEYPNLIVTESRDEWNDTVKHLVGDRNDQYELNYPFSKLNQYTESEPVPQLVLLPSNKQSQFTIYEITQEYRQFEKYASPFISLAKNMINNGTNIKNVSNNNFVFDEFNFLPTDIKSIPINYTTYDYPISIEYKPVEIIDLGPNPIEIIFKNTMVTIIPSIYIPTYDDDVLEWENDNVLYKLRNDDGTKYSIYLDPDETQFEGFGIDIDSPIKKSDATAIFKLINTGKYLIEFIEKLFAQKENIRNLVVETTNWNQQINDTSPEYVSRSEKKSKLLTVAKILQEIDTKIKQEYGNYYYLDIVLVDKKTAPSKKIYYTNVISTVLSEIEELNPVTDYFNAKIDKMWIFIRKIFIAWYTIFTIMFTTFLLNRCVNKIIDFIKLITGNDTNYFGDRPYKYSTNKFTGLMERAPKQYEYVKREIEFAQNKIIQKMNDKNIIPNIDPTIMTIVNHNQYYSNLDQPSTNQPSTDIYTVMIMVKQDQQHIIDSLRNVAIQTENLLNVEKILLKYLKQIYISNYIKSIIRSTKKTSPTINYNDIMQKTIEELITNIKTDFMGSIPQPILIEINSAKTKFTNVQNVIDNEYQPENKPTEFVKNTILKSPNFVLSQGIYTKVESTSNIKNNYYYIINSDWDTDKKINNFVIYTLTILYRGIVKGIINYITETIPEKIVIEIRNTKCVALEKIYELISKYILHRKYIKKYCNSCVLPQLNGIPDTNKIISIIYDPLVYQNNKIEIDKIDKILREKITYFVGENLIKYYKAELKLYEKFYDLNKNLKNKIDDIKMNIQDRNSQLKNIIDVITMIMFNDNYKNFAFVDLKKIREYTSQISENFEIIQQMVEQSIYSLINKEKKHVLASTQINNHMAFKILVKKTINNKPLVENVYKRMSFGLIEYYYDILSRIIDCWGDKPFDNMGDIEQYLYEYHFIQIMRCFELFKWIRTVFQIKKISEDNAYIKTLSPPERKTHINVLKQKIYPLETSGDILSVFTEFIGLRRYLDQYSAVAMEKVQLHLRINDFEDVTYNNSVKNKYQKKTGFDYKFLQDVDPNTNADTYDDRWDNNGMLFTNGKGTNILKVNFDLLDKIYKIDNPGRSKDYGVFYQSTYAHEKNGIPFERIYNTKIFPDSDVIANYMSIAQNILAGKGTVIMTYGYSGVGKSASLFGREANPNKGIMEKSNGILQATMDQFPDDIEIYFRVFEIYGLGVQYNYYWNPENNDENESTKCYPDFYQCIIHHDLDTSSNDVLKIKNRLIFTNRHDMFSYILQFNNPDKANKLTINNKNDPNLGGNRNYSEYFDSKHTNINPMYAKINRDQYRNFTKFIDNDLDTLRADANGNTPLTIKRIIDHKIRQIKGTVNNRVSSRSILVYDFEIKKTGESPVPFLIYDLPGKEDIYKTYVEPSDDSKMDEEYRSRVFKNVDGPNSKTKERKSTYVLNPILIPIFDDNTSVVIKLMKELTDPNDPNGPKMKEDLEKKLVEYTLKYQVTNIIFMDDDPFYRDNGEPYKISEFFKDQSDIKTFEELFNGSNIDEKYYEGDDAIQKLVFEKGITKENIAMSKESSDVETEIIKEIHKMVCIVLIGYLIKFGLFDVIVSIIETCVNDGKQPSERNGGWTADKIHAFFEGMYINENVIGLLEFLIRKILDEPSGIEEQYSVVKKYKMSTDINKNYKMANKYGIIKYMYDNQEPFDPDDNFGLEINKDLFDAENNKLKAKEINKFIEENHVQKDNGQYYLIKPGDYLDQDVGDVFEKIKSTITFENRGKYDSNKIFRKGMDSSINCKPIRSNDDLIINPEKAINPNVGEIMKEKNRPLLQDFIEPFERKISFYYVFYVVSNSQVELKGEEQVKLLNNSMPFISKMDPSKKKKRRVSHK